MSELSGGRLLPTPPEAEPSSVAPSIGCDDIESFTFTQGTGLSKDCSWITKNKVTMKERKQKFCSQNDIFNNCRGTCEACAPSPYPSMSFCEDSVSFVFQVGSNASDQNCQWLTKNHIKKQQRLDEYCGKSYSGTVVKDACPLSCDYVSINVEIWDQPSTSPIVTPSISPMSELSGGRLLPTPPEAEPSSVAPSIGCDDIESFTFSQGTGLSKDCSWITKNKVTMKERKQKFCSRNDIFNNCRGTCGACAPSSHAPSSYPSMSSCEDSVSFVFQVGSNASDQNCQWLTKNHIKKQQRLDGYCGKSYSGTVVKDACPLSCDNCPID